ncbi:MAG TPA: cob(I)yrinic acid a,c-diamide adenosyltransferase [Armatimonadetes bacterium]|nr:cob(I)yrinic acid a,c-diamide adenosyltransferase [Armatimonadota bacterium]
MTRIYTRTGDEGKTGLVAGERISKASLRVGAYGAVDELNALLGVVRTVNPEAELGTLLARLQEELFVLGGDLATPRSSPSPDTPRIEASHVKALEETIDHYQAQIPPWRLFVLPGGCPLAAYLHYARAVCRRAERCVVALAETEEVGPHVVPYLNRLSDLLFVLARWANRQAGVEEQEWEGKGR